MPGQHAHDQQIKTVFRSEADWFRVQAQVSQLDDVARVSVAGGDLDATAAQVCRFLSLDIGNPVIAHAQRRLPGRRPCGFRSPYEAAAWAVLSQRIRIVQAAKLVTT